MFCFLKETNKNKKKNKENKKQKESCSERGCIKHSIFWVEYRAAI